jgi:hypothetical protein
MSNFATFSEFYELLKAFRSQIDSNEFLKLAAFDDALQCIKDLCDKFAENDADCYPSYSLLTSLRSKLNIPLDITILDAIARIVIDELERIIREQQATFKAAVRAYVEELYSSFTDEKEQQLIVFLRGANARGFNCPVLFPILRSLKAEYFKPGCLFEDYAELFTRLLKQFGPTRFEWGHYDFTPTDTHYYLSYRSLKHSQPPPYSARDIGREIQVAREREETLQSAQISSSAPEIRTKKPY